MIAKVKTPETGAYSMKRVLVAEALDQEGIDLLKQHFAVDTRELTSEEELKEIIPQYDGLMIKTYTRVSKEVIDRAVKLKVVARAGTGLDRVDIAYAKTKGIIVRNTPEANIVSVAEMVFALMLGMARKIVLGDRYVRSQSGWDRDQFIGAELSQKTLGIIGLGHIGQRVAKRATGFEMRLISYDPLVEAGEMAPFGVEKVETLDDLLRRADFITLHVPLIDATYHLIGRDQLALMKRTAILVNTSRGPVVDQEALLTALKEGGIAGAGLDVFEVEPPQDKGFLGLENVVLSPHVGAATHEALKKMTSQAAQIIIENLKG
jgi:D-3-phosphoglycerate dehydrogenase